MIVYEACVYDCYVPSATAVYSSAAHLEKLGLGDQIGLMAIVDHNAALAITVQIEHSTDGITFVNERAAASPELSSSLVANQLKTIYAGESWPTSPSLRFVRFRIGLSGGTPGPSGHVRLFAVVHDRRGMPDRCGCSDTSSSAGPGGGDRPARIVYGSSEQVHENRTMEVAFLKQYHPRGAFSELTRAIARAPLHLTGAARLSAAIASLPAGRRDELMEFAKDVRSVDPRSAADAIEEILRGRGDE